MLQIVFDALPVDTVVDIQNGFHLSLSKQILLKDSSDEASVSVKGHLFAEVFISWGSVLLDVTHLVFCDPYQNSILSVYLPIFRRPYFHSFCLHQMCILMWVS